MWRLFRYVLLTAAEHEVLGFHKMSAELAKPWFASIINHPKQHTDNYFLEKFQLVFDVTYVVFFSLSRAAL
jgi:hypothetical protein